MNQSQRGSPIDMSLRLIANLLPKPYKRNGEATRKRTIEILESTFSIAQNLTSRHSDLPTLSTSSREEIAAESSTIGMPPPGWAAPPTKNKFSKSSDLFGTRLKADSIP